MRLAYCLAFVLFSASCNDRNEGDTTVAPICLEGEYAKGKSCQKVPATAPVSGATWLVQSGWLDSDSFLDSAADESGALFLLGHRSGAAALGDSGKTEVFLSKKSLADATELATFSYGPTAWTRGSALAMSASGDPVVSGIEVSPSGEARPFLALHDASTLAQTTKLSFAATEGAVPVTLQCRGGACYVAGVVNGVVEGKVPVGKSDIFVARVKGDLSAVEWVAVAGTAEVDTPVAMEVQESGDVWVAGTTTRTIPDSKNSGGLDVLLVEFTASGEVAQLSQGGTSGDDSPAALHVTEKDVTILGSSPDNCDIKSGLDGMNLVSWRLAREGGTLQERHCAGGTGQDFITRGLWNESAQRFVFVGYTTGVLNSGEVNSGDRDGFVGRSSPTLSDLSVRQFGTVLSDRPLALALASGSYVVAGETEGNFSVLRKGRTDLFALAFPQF